MTKEESNILIIEDDAIISMFLEDTLRIDGYNVCCVLGSGEEALSCVSLDKPNLLIADVSLDGEMSGIELAYQAKNRFNIPTLFITGNRNLVEKDNRFAIIAPWDVLDKPLNKGLILACLNKHISEK